MNYLAIKINEDEFKHFNVPTPVYNYVKQLETAIIHRKFDGIERLYPGRFCPILHKLATAIQEFIDEQTLLEDWSAAL